MRGNFFSPLKFFGPTMGPWEGLNNSRFNSLLRKLVLEVFEPEKEEEEEDMLK